MEHDGEARKALRDLLQHIEAQGRRHQDALLIAGALGRGKLVGAMAGADGDGQGVAAGLGHELLYFLGTGVRGILSGDLHIILHTGQGTQLRLDHHAMVVGVLNDLLGDGNILLEGLGAGIDHHGGETTVDAGLTGLKIGAVIQMQSDGNIGALDHSGLHQLHQIGVVGIGTSALGHLQDQGSLLLLSGLGDALNDFHVVDIEGTDGIPAVIGLFEHFSRGNQWHIDHLLERFLRFILYHYRLKNTSACVTI